MNVRMWNREKIMYGKRATEKERTDILSNCTSVEGPNNETHKGWVSKTTRKMQGESIEHS
jgi:hypothetical protein